MEGRADATQGWQGKTSQGFFPRFWGKTGKNWEKPGKTGKNREKLGKTGNNWEKLGKTQN